MLIRTIIGVLGTLMQDAARGLHWAGGALLDAASRDSDANQTTVLGMGEWSVGDAALAWSLQSDSNGGFIDGKACTVMGFSDDGKILVSVERQFGFESRVDPRYAVWPEQLRRPGCEGIGVRRWKRGEMCLLYAAQSWSQDPLGIVRKRGILARLHQDMLEGGKSVILDIPGFPHRVEAYAAQIRRP